ncbi:MAG TPA: HPF/RaiA family ribosome-associated protein [Steroidobacteraceae bacterium]|jgi:ribosome-associated translation inhibitor RaiA|nr:HPF/RaiA family ribosome-associated protein [Steroidobacteraceae bacterium]
MQIQINHDNHVRLGEDVEQRLAGTVRDFLDRFGDRITRVEVYMSDVNGQKGGDDKRCLLEARLANLAPIAVSDNADSYQLAFEGALDKLEHALNHTVGKLETH